MTFSAYALLGDGRYRERHGLAFEDFAPGQRFVHRPGVTLSQQDNVDEALDTMNAAMLHYDAHYAAQTTWKNPLMVSTITLQRAIGLATKTFGQRRAIARFKEIKMTGPLFGGDTIYASSDIIACKDGPDADTGTVEVRTAVSKPDGTEVAALTYDAVIWRRGRGPDGELAMAPEPASTAGAAMRTAPSRSRSACSSRTSRRARPSCTTRAVPSTGARPSSTPGARSTGTPPITTSTGSRNTPTASSASPRPS